jgi:hypothetical protein
MQAFPREWESRCAGLGVDYFRAEMNEPYFAALERYLIGRSAILR